LVERRASAHEQLGSFRIDAPAGTRAQAASEPEPRKTHWAPGSAEWQAEQDAESKAQIEAAAVDGTAGSSPSGPHSKAP